MKHLLRQIYDDWKIAFRPLRRTEIVPKAGCRKPKKTNRLTHKETKEPPPPPPPPPSRTTKW